METTRNTRTLEISGMTGDVCVQKVTAALREVRGVSIQSVKVGRAVISADQAGCVASCVATGSAGYTARAADIESSINRACGPVDKACSDAKPEPTTASSDMRNEGAGGAIGHDERTNGKSDRPARVSPVQPAIPAAIRA